MNILLVTLFGIFIGASITAYIAVVAIEKRNRKILNFVFVKWKLSHIIIENWSTFW